jgi:hypothetical protein
MLIKTRNQIDLLIFFVFLIATTLGYIMLHTPLMDQQSFYIKNSFGNIMGVVVGSFLFLWIRKETTFIKREWIILSVGIGLMIYELFQIYIPWQTFDFKDILWSIAGIAIASIINIFIMGFVR